MTKVNVTESPIAKYNTPKELSMTAATSTTAEEAEEFEFTLTNPATNCVILIENGSATADMAYSFSKGDFPVFAREQSGVVPKGKTVAVQLEGGNVIQTGGKTTLTLTPAETAALKTDHAAKVGIIELIG